MKPCKPKTSYRQLALLSVCLLLTPVIASADICQEGLGVPPFLSAGVDPNLLLVLDNSGSMLDAAYHDTAADAQRCFDDTYNSTHPYAGYFQSKEWYRWTESAYPPWKKGVEYKQGDRVYAYGIIWEAEDDGTSNGARVDEDTGVTWQHILDIAKWANNRPYAAGSIVWSGHQLYIAAAAGTSNDSNSSNGLSLEEDTGVTWTEIDSTWRAGENYAAGDIVTYKGIYYEALAVSTGTTPGSNIATWKSLNEGSFQVVDKDSATTHCSTATGTSRSHSDLCISVDGSVTPNQVTAFAASGNFLNWAMASKFDIQKKILTGGKYNYSEKQMISENRGCSGSRFIKQIQFNDGYHLSMGIRGSKYDDDPDMEDRVDTTDDVGRLEILAITQNGFVGSQECQDALEYITTKGLNGSQQKIKDCTDTFPTTNKELADQNPVLNHSLQFCWQLENHQRNLGNIMSECEHLYTGWHISQSYLPTELTPAYGAYICYGTFDPTLDHINRNGYVGRCWNPGGAVGGVSCNPKAAVSAAGGGCSGEGCEYGSQPNRYKNELGYNYKCTSFLNNGSCRTSKQDVPGNRKYWNLQYEWSDHSGSCDPNSPPPGSSTAGWDQVWDSNPSSNDPNNCILQASIDYCNDTKVPEVIDPSDEAGDTTNYWNIPGLLTDSEVVAQLGASHPLAVMKGYIQYPERPQGLLHEVADNIRLGAMAFNKVGADTECLPEYRTNGISRYCPKVNQDGAELLTSINLGSFITDNNDTTYTSGKRRHVDDLAESVNAIRATSWTPLAEAMFNALGYYTQNSKLCLNKDNNGNCLDFPINSNDDPIEYSCQNNNIIVITEGESTTDINPNVTSFVADPSPYFGNPATPKDNVAGDGKPEPTNPCDKLAGSTYFDDMTWWGQHLGPLYAERQKDELDKKNILTQIVTTSALAPGTTECDAKVLMENAANNGGKSLLSGENPADLEKNLRAAFNEILFRTSAGSAASVISSSRSGEGGVYQAIFWPMIDRGFNKPPLEWAGDVHAFFIDEHGLLWDDYSSNGADGHVGELWTEDKNADGILQQAEDLNGNDKLDGDRRVITYFNSDTNSTQICFRQDVVDTGVCGTSDYLDTPTGSVELRDFNKYLWSASVQLQSITDIAENRKLLDNGTWDYSDNRRYIFTWNDLDNDGLVDSDFDRDGTVDDDGTVDGDGKKIDQQEEILPLVPGINNPALSVAGAVSPRGDFLSDFKMTSNVELDRLILWLRGEDIYEKDTNNNNILEASEDINNNGVRDYALRCRKYKDCDDPNALNNPTWRLGDVIHSTPTLAARPAEGYHLAYKDPSYARFYKERLNRRHVIYFGGNDGMLHAVNGGFYVSGKNKFLSCSPSQRLSTDKNKCEIDTPYSANSVHAYPALGDELWAYVPYNLQPHLSCLADPEYAHKYYVDAPPRLFDVRIFPDNDGIHTDGWGTILVGYMRFGGAPALADNTFPYTDNRKFISSYFILDITDPERPPTLLGEMTMTTDTKDHGSGLVPQYADMGYTTAMPTLTAMRDENGFSEWYLIIGNGPTTLKGANDQQGKVGIIPLNALTGVNWKANNGGSYVSTDRRPFRIPNTEPSAALDHFGIKRIPGQDSFVGDMVSVDFDIKDDAIPGVGVPYKSDIVYFGTVDGSDFDATRKYWDGDGRLFRLVTKIPDGTGNESYSYPGSWYLKKMMDARGPITAAPNVGTDGSNFWVYFGTGRFYTEEDKTDDSTEYFFGVKEPLDANCNLSWDTVNWWGVAPTPSAAPGQQGLFRADQIKVIEYDRSDPNRFLGNYFYCDSCTVPLSPVSSTDVDSIHSYYAFSDLEKYIKGEKCGGTADTTIGIDGWYREFTDARERSLGMPTLLGGLVTYTSYRPFEDICRAEGDSYLYGVYYLTGTAWYENVFGTYDDADQKVIVRDRLSLGKGLATTPSLQTGGGPHQVNAYIQTSTGEIVKVGQDNLPLFNFKSGRTNWRNR